MADTCMCDSVMSDLLISKVMICQSFSFSFSLSLFKKKEYVMLAKRDWVMGIERDRETIIGSRSTFFNLLLKSLTYFTIVLIFNLK